VVAQNTLAGAAVGTAGAGPSGTARAGGSLGALSVAVVMLLAASVWVFLEDPQGLPWSTYAVAVALLWVSAIPLVRFVWRPAARTFGFVPVICAIYFVYYGRPAFLSTPIFARDMKQGASMEAIAPALMVALFGVLAIASLPVLMAPALKRLPRITTELDLSRCAPWLVVLSGVAFVFRVGAFNWFPRGSTFAQELALIHQLGQLAASGLLIACLRRQVPRWMALYLAGLTIAYVLFALAIGVLAEAVFSVAPLFFAYVWERGRLPWGAMAACVLVLAPLQATKEEFRKRTWEGGGTIQNSMSVLQRLEILGSLLDEAIERRTLTVEAVNEGDAARTNYLGTLAFVLDATPRRVPYWDGGTYTDFAWHLVPRFVVPDKPARSIGQEFPRRYGLIDASDDVTAYNLAQLVELYINFGFVGVALGMPMIALIYAVLDRVFGGSTAGALVGAQLFAPLLNVESDAASVFGGLIFLSLALYAFVRLLPREGSGSASRALTSTATA
jgi:hypothetical protein